MHKALALVAMFAVMPALAEEPKEAAAPPAAAAPAAAPAEKAAAPAAAAEGRPYVDAAVAFLKGLTHSSRAGDAGEQGWSEAKENAAEKVVFKVAGKEMALDLAGKKADARVVKFQKVATLREGAAVKGVTLDNVELKIGADSHSGKATLLMEEKDGKWMVTSVEVD
jgi:hypothetical protein